MQQKVVVVCLSGIGGCISKLLSSHGTETGEISATTTETAPAADSEATGKPHRAATDSG